MALARTSAKHAKILLENLTASPLQGRALRLGSGYRKATARRSAFRSAPQVRVSMENGGDEGDRTPDLVTAINEKRV
jgi:hypothetical protein